MSKQIAKILTILCWLIIPLLLWNFYRLSYNPYGWTFWINLYTAIVILTLLIANYGFKQFYSKRMFRGFIFLSIAMSISITAIIVTLDYRTLFFSDTKKELSTKEWKEDVLFLKENILKRHPNVYSLISREAFEKQFNFIEENIDNWNANKIKIQLMKTVSLMNDGHSIIPPQPAINFNCLPFITHKFDDGVYIINSAKSLEHLKGAKLTAIGNMPINKVFEKLEPYIGVENIGGKWDRFPLYSVMTELLFDLGITENSLSAKISYTKDGIDTIETIEGKSYYKWLYFYFSPDRKNNQMPFEHKMLNNSYWYDYNSTKKEIYVNVNNLQDQSGESIKAFSKRLNDFITKNEVGKTILDLRNNRGGNNFKARHLLKVFRDNPKTNKQGAFFTLISRRTFSAAVNLATLLENQTETIFVGEPTGQGPTQYGDAKQVTLPNSKILLPLSSLKWQGALPQDNRQSIAPDYTVTYTSKDYLNQIDPALKLIESIKIKQKKTIVSNTIIDDVVGNYLMNDDQILSIKKDSNGYKLSATDFIPGSLRDIHTVVYQGYTESEFNTSINGFRLSIRNKTPSIIFYKDTIELVQLEKGFQFPIQKIVKGNYDEGIIEMNNHIEVYKNYPLEGYLNRLGYKKLYEKETDLAVKIFKLNTKLFPISTNVWDSYGEALLVQGLVKEAKDAYKRILELDPENKAARNMLLKFN